MFELQKGCYFNSKFKGHFILFCTYAFTTYFVYMFLLLVLCLWQINVIIKFCDVSWPVMFATFFSALSSLRVGCNLAVC